MVSENQFYSVAEQKLEDHTEMKVICCVRGHSGYLVCINHECTIVDDEFDGLERLPSFIETEDAAKKYLAKLNVAYMQGKEDGKSTLKSELGSLLGFAKKEYVDYLDVRTNEKLDRIS